MAFVNCSVVKSERVGACKADRVDRVAYDFDGAFEPRVVAVAQ